MAPPQSQINSTSIRPSKPLTIYRRGKPIQQNEEIDSNSDSESNSNQDPIENQDGIIHHSTNQPITPIMNLEISTKNLTSNQTIDQKSSSDDNSSDSSDSNSTSKAKLN
ncbi:hypothetical protein CROQUDRAFT_653044 [Cronartium quercuum f. sp. fusiforme G11]|uniref:Uncharacterized protein n=1 Tax=Cronartium quercuum f. sp. fusiforme G11 TaxID=708437 RepID=A0A9P6NUZ9_9BASI|nr:hypothetical protein CROQUDRAFT_653044 [Cronartium quercuum f. sp. fusiforme G11]